LPLSRNLASLLLMNPFLKFRGMLIALFFTWLVTSGNAQSPPEVYRLVDGTTGKEVKWKKLLKATKEVDVVLFGEVHDHPVIHWLELQLLQDLHATSENGLILAMEMLEADQQGILDAYLARGTGYEAQYDQLRLWGNYETDYAPLVAYANRVDIPVVASNIPREYASRVYQGGQNAIANITSEERSWMAPMPIDIDFSLSQYQAMAQMLQSHAAHGHGRTADVPPPAPDSAKVANFISAQAVKDATMAWNTLQAISSEGTRQAFHVHGRFHSDYQQGIIWYLRHYRPEVTTLSISTVVVEDPAEGLPEDEMGVADFVLLIPDQMARSYDAMGQ